MADDEVLAAFKAFWTVGSTNEDWVGWVDSFTPDVEYVERQFGTMHGREAVREWITTLMAARADVHAVLNWYIVAGDRVVFDMWNRYHHPDPAGSPIDFAGLTVLTYGGDGLFKREEDYWDVTGSKAAYMEWSTACKAVGSKGDPDRLKALESQRISDNLRTLETGRVG